ncbi:uncharacterized protein TNIN_486071, partial [Trichonephila inaurata madagascariensis]
MCGSATGWLPRE